MAQTENIPNLDRDDIKSGKSTLDLEARGIQALSEALSGNLGKPFVAALDIISAVTGRLIITGMGKSGHIGRKIAATLASTGTPAFFIHPGEASHGDLGMITVGDAILAMSNSGETSELADTVAHAARFSIPLISITGRMESTLSDAADVALVLPDAPEACPMGLAPTTSTTMTLALGDAIAMALLDRKGFSASDFQIFHPGGKLGSQLLKVGKLMHGGQELPLVTGDLKMSTAIIEMTEKRFGCLGVISNKDKEGDLIGIVTDGDLRRHMSSDILSQKVSDIMTENARTITPETLASEALAIMNEKSITSLFVVSDKKPVGIIHIHDCLRAGVA